MNRRSIRFRLTAWYAAILAVTLAAAGLGVWIALRDAINDTADKELRARLAATRAFIRHAAAEGQPLDEVMEGANFAPAGSHFRIADVSGRWLYQSAGARSSQPLPRDLAALPARGRFETVMERGKPIRIVTAAAPPFVVQIGFPLDEFAEMLDAFAWTALLASPIVLLLASAAGYWMSRRALAPVEEIASAAEDIEARNLSERLPMHGSGDELDHLSGALNGMLARLEDSFRRITQFTADASHELRTPVAIIRTTAEVARRKPRTGQQYAETLDSIVAESERTTRLVEDLMLLARADAGETNLRAEPVDVPSVARSACAEARVLAEKAGVDLALDRAANCTVSGDDEALDRLLLILLDNAIKYSKPQGWVRVSVDAGEWHGRSAAVVEVRDNGIGISPEDLPHLFDRFYRASKDRSRKVDGVGLGLSIAQTIARRHGGDIAVESELGVGSTVRVFLPQG